MTFLQQHPRQQHILKQFTLFLGLLLLSIGCGSKANRLPELSAEEIVGNSAEAMRDLDGFRFNIDRDGALAYLDPGHTLAFGSAIGDYVTPDRARAQVKVIGPGLVTTVSVISVGAVQWETNVITGVWTELPPDWGFNPTIIFDAEIGLQAILTEDTSELVVLPPEKIADGPDQLLYAVSGKMQGERVHLMSGLLIGPDELTFELWVMPETFEVIRVIITDPPDADSEQTKPTIWQLDFSQFNQTVEIEPPDL